MLYSSRVRVKLRLRISVSVVHGYAHVFVLFFDVIVTLPICYRQLPRVFREHKLVGHFPPSISTVVPPPLHV